MLRVFILIVGFACVHISLFGNEISNGRESYFNFAYRKNLGLGLPSDEAQKWAKGLSNYVLLRFELFEREIQKLLKPCDQGGQGLSVEAATPIAIRLVSQSRPRTLSEAYIKRGLESPAMEWRRREIAKDLTTLEEKGIRETSVVTSPWAGPFIVDRFRQKDYLFGNKNLPVLFEVNVYRGIGPRPYFYPYYYPGCRLR